MIVLDFQNFNNKNFYLMSFYHKKQHWEKTKKTILTLTNIKLYYIKLYNKAKVL